MPGIERKLPRYPQLYSRVGFVHDFNTLALARLEDGHRQQMDNLKFPEAATEAVYAAIMRVTEGNLRL
jgi:hypothetical protein